MKHRGSFTREGVHEMGIVDTPPRQDVHLVAMLTGSATMDGATYFKARAWLLEDRRLIIATATPDYQIKRNQYEVETASLSKKSASFTLTSGEEVKFKLKSCNCGMGIVGSARVMDERHQLVKVIPPEWVTTS